jgi:hypothetical protein
MTGKLIISELSKLAIISGALALLLIVWGAI